MIRLVETRDLAEVQRINEMFPDTFLKLTDRELIDGHWWIAYLEMEAPTAIAGFCGYLPFEPFKGYVYLKRAAVFPEYRGRGLQHSMIRQREAHARSLGKTHAITETEITNPASGNSMIKNGYKLFAPMRPWTADKEYVYWIKEL